jgi:hypothetical protein
MHDFGGLFSPSCTVHRNFGNLEIRNFGTLEHWNSGTLEHWNTGTLEPTFRNL